MTDVRVVEFAESILGEQFAPPMTALGIEKDGEIVAGAVFTFYTGINVDVSIAGAGWTKGFIQEVGRYVYDQMGCERMTIRTEQKDVAGYAMRLGGKVEGILRSFYGRGRNAILVGILADEWTVKD